MINKKRLLALAAAATAFSSLGACSRVQDNEVAIDTVYGKVTKVRNESSEKGLIWTMWPIKSWGHELHQYTTRNQEIVAANTDTVAVTNEDGDTINAPNPSAETVMRTKDNFRVEGTIVVRFSIDQTDPKKVTRLFTKLTAPGEESKNAYQEDLQRLIMLAAPTAIEKFDSEEISIKKREIGQAIEKELQRIVDSEQLPFKIELITPEIRLTEEAEARYEQIAQLNAREQQAEKRISIAAKEREAAVAEATTTSAVYGQFRDAGATPEVAAELICLENKAAGKKTGGPCIRGTALGLAVAPK